MTGCSIWAMMGGCINATYPGMILHEGDALGQHLLQEKDIPAEAVHEVHLPGYVPALLEVPVDDSEFRRQRSQSFPVCEKSFRTDHPAPPQKNVTLTVQGGVEPMLN